jgi:6-phosphofructokinase
MADRTQEITPKRLGILTSGGDCPGLNAVIYAVVKYARTCKLWQVYGIPNGTDGFVDIANGVCQPEDLELHEHSFDIPGQKGINVLLFLSGSVLGCRGKKVSRADSTGLSPHGLRCPDCDRWRWQFRDHC